MIPSAEYPVGGRLWCPWTTNQMERLVNAGLTVPDSRGVLHSQLAEDAPSLENGLWTLSADGRMETTWRIRSNAAWHDGVALTAEDLLFTARVEQDRELAGVWSGADDPVEGVGAVDERTVRIRWKRPFVEAAVADPRFRRALMHAMDR